MYDDPERGSRASLNLVADCANCVALCCVAPAFAKSADFAIDKRAGQACPNLAHDFGCGIHAKLRGAGFGGCTVYDCFGAGQQVTQVTYGGRDWRSSPQLAGGMFSSFTVMRHLHELLYYVDEALDLVTSAEVHDDLVVAFADLKRLTPVTPDALLKIDIGRLRDEVNFLLQRASELARSDLGQAVDRRGADLIGANFAGADLRGANLRGALLIGANLSGADLHLADLTGADLRGADLRRADLSGSIFLIQSQLAAAVGDKDTRLPSHRKSPDHWLSSVRPT